MLSATKPFVKFHQHDQNLLTDIQTLNSSGYKKEDIWVISWDPDKNHSNQRDTFYSFPHRSDEIIGEAQSKAQFFSNGGEEIRTKLEKLGLTKDEASALFRELKDTSATSILVVRDLKDNIIEMNTQIAAR